MRTIAHMSDLHFGRVRTEIVDALLADVAALSPNLIVISGDLTQRASRRQFEAAHGFLARLPVPWVAVPGNHDIPTMDPIARFTRPLSRFRRYVSRETHPFWMDEEIAVFGINTARSWVWDWSHGRVSWNQMDAVRVAMHEVPADRFRIVFAHHPFLPPPTEPGTRLVGRAVPALKALEEAGVEMLLAGHLHRAYTGDIMSHHTHVARSILVAQASTATSTRLRSEPNAYNLITIDGPAVSFEVRSWEGASFMPGLVTRFRRDGSRWIRVETDPGPGITAG
jgi:3',5'-cyclic AMP phosphodiesterase CpdA